MEKTHDASDKLVNLTHNRGSYSMKSLSVVSHLMRVSALGLIVGSASLIGCAGQTSTDATQQGDALKGGTPGGGKDKTKTNNGKHGGQAGSAPVQGGGAGAGVHGNGNGNGNGSGKSHGEAGAGGGAAHGNGNGNGNGKSHAAAGAGGGAAHGNGKGAGDDSSDDSSDESQN